MHGGTSFSVAANASRHDRGIWGEVVNGLGGGAWEINLSRSYRTYWEDINPLTSRNPCPDWPSLPSLAPWPTFRAHRPRLGPVAVHSLQTKPSPHFLSFPRKRESIGLFGHRLATASGCLPSQAWQCVVIGGYPCLAIVNRENGFVHSPQIGFLMSSSSWEGARQARHGSNFRASGGK